MGYIWPIVLVVLSNVAYHICEKSVPDNVHPFAALTVTYLIGAVLSALLYGIFSKGGDLFREWGKLNWSSFVLGVIIIGLEVGFLLAYKAGWDIGKASLVQSIILAVVLLLVGWLGYKEPMTWNKIVGFVVCLAGLVIINL